MTDATRTGSMQLSIDRDSLLSALKQVDKVIERRNTIPILANALIHAEGDTLTLTSNDLDMEVTTRIVASVTVPGTTTAPAAVLRTFVDRLPSGAAVTLDLDGYHLKLRAGRTRATLSTLPADDFPHTASGDYPTRFAMSARVFAGLLERVSFAISTNEMRYYLNGVYLHLVTGVAGPMLRAVATDGHRLALREVAAPNGSDGLPGVIVPRKAVAEIIRMLAPMGDESVDISVSKAKLRLDAGTTTLITKLIDDTFPDYERAIPRANPRIAKLLSDDLAIATNRVLSVADGSSRAVKFAFGPDGLELEGRSGGEPNADAGDHVAMDWDDDDMIEIGFNGSYVLDICRNLPATHIRMALADAGSPCLITPDDRTSGCLFVLMPMRV